MIKPFHFQFIYTVVPEKEIKNLIKGKKRKKNGY